jgi:cysteine-rich repeat protein
MYRFSLLLGALVLAGCLQDNLAPTTTPIIIDAEPDASVQCAAGDTRRDAQGNECVCGDDGAWSCDRGLSPVCAFDENGVWRCGPNSEPFCGDGVVDPETEACDNGGQAIGECPYGEENCRLCTADCALEARVGSWCGDGVVDPAHEECDDGNGVVTDGCTDQCRVAAPQLCGDTCSPTGTVGADPKVTDVIEDFRPRNPVSEDFS